MSTLCKGEVKREGAQWFCLDCGMESTAWSLVHAPLQTRAMNFLNSLVTVAKESTEQALVGAGGTPA